MRVTLLPPGGVQGQDLGTGSGKDSQTQIETAHERMLLGEMVGLGGERLVGSWGELLSGSR